MEHHKKDQGHYSGGSLNGFFFGILVGVAITLLFTTKKGRRLLRSLTDEGLEKVSKWEDLLNKKIDEKIDSINDDLEEREFVEVVEEPVKSVNTEAAEKPKSNGIAKKPTPHIEPEIEVKEGPPVRHSVRRFFKTAKKK